MRHGVDRPSFGSSGDELRRQAHVAGLAHATQESTGLPAVTAQLGFRVLFVPEEIVVATWRALRPNAEATCEGVVMWAAPRAQYDELQQVVTTVIVPRQRVGPGRYQLPADAVREMGQALRRRGLVNVAQVHSHPGEWVDHSDWDDAHTFSLRDGALSIVWPAFGRELPPADTWGVHECGGRIWRRLGPSEVGRRVVILPLVLDLRVGLLGFDMDTGVDGEDSDA